jgi:zinc protease
MTIRISRSLVALAACLTSIFPGSPEGLRAQSAETGPSIPNELSELANGLRLVLSVDRSLPIVGSYLCYHVGSANEEPGRTGLAHLFEHLMSKGTANADKNEFARIVEEGGGTRNAWMNRDFTCYVATVPSNLLETVLWFEADRLANLLDGMTEEKVEVEKDVVRNERREVFENPPYGLAYETLHAAFYPAGHPYRQIQIGAMADIAAATLSDVQHFFRTHYVPNNAVLALVGDFDPEAARQSVEDYFGGIAEGHPAGAARAAVRYPDGAEACAAGGRGAPSGGPDRLACGGSVR